MRDQRKYIVLIVLSFALIIGWQYFLSWMWPTAPKPQPDPAKTAAAAFPPLEERQLQALLNAGAGAFLADVPLLGNVSRLATAGFLSNPRVQVRLENETARLVLDRATAPNPVLSGGLSAAVAVAGSQGLSADLRGRAVREMARRIKTTRAVANRQEKRLGDESTNIQATLTTLGAGVQSVTLNRFKSANRLGLREESDLRLIPKMTDAEGAQRPSFLLFHCPTDDPSARPFDTLGNLDWVLQEDSIKKTTAPSGEQVISELTFTTEVPGQDVILSKTYTLAPGDYHLGLTVRIQRKPGFTGPVKFQYQLAGGHGLPIEGDWYTSTYRTTLIGRVDAKNNLERDYQESRTISVEQGGKRFDRTDSHFIRYAAVAVQYFASAIVVDNQQKDQDFLQWARPTLPWTGYPVSEPRPQFDDITVRVNTKVLDLKQDASIEHKYLLYHGPVKVALLEHGIGGSQPVDSELVARYKETLRLDTFTDYKFPTTPEFFTSIGWTYLIIKCTNLMHGILVFLSTTLHLGHGISIILLTILVRLAMFPIGRKQALMSIKMQALAPKLKELQAQFKDNPQAKQQAVMELYRKHGVNPFGSCWVMLLQMPIFMGLYYSLQESVHFRLASFLWIPSLAAPDMLIWWGENIPLLSNPESQGSVLSFFYLGPYFNLLPIVAIAFMVVHQKLFTPPPTDEQQATQMKMMKYMMIFMGVMFYRVAAGLALYFIMSSAWGLAERRLLPKSQTADPLAAAESKQAKAAPAARGKPKPAQDKKESNGTLRRLQDWWHEVLRQAGKK